MKDRIKMTYQRMFLEEWNRKIYKDDNGNPVDGNMQAEHFWNEFGIKSYPKFKDSCYSHIPGKWADDVRVMIKSIQTELGDRIEFKQIKEKYCHLTVYFSAKDSDAEYRAGQIIQECKNRLIGRGLHPKSGLLS